MGESFDLAVIGSGPGGYPAAIQAAQKGKKVALIESAAVGGTCLNRGCIPSKALISNAALWKKIQKAQEYGIFLEHAGFDYKKMSERKNALVNEMRLNLENLLKANKVTLIKGHGKFLSPKEIKVTGETDTLIFAEKTIIATGSESRKIKALPIDGKHIHDSTTFLEMEKLPTSIAIVGGGVIGCEFASLMNAFGVEVHLIEMLSRLVPTECASISKALQEAFEKKGIQLHLSSSVKQITHLLPSSLQIHLTGGKVIKTEMALSAVGRSFNVDKIDLDKAGVLLREDGLIAVNDKMETTSPGIYAVGDIASKYQLAHVATHQGLVAASNACGKSRRMSYRAVPSVIFTDPEIASVGLSLKQAQDQGYNAHLAAFPFTALGKARASLETEGFAQIVVDQQTKEILGAQVVGFDAGNLIAEMGIAIANELTVECIEETIHAHPTLSEIWMESAIASTGSPLHLPPPKKGRFFNL